MHHIQLDVISTLTIVFAALKLSDVIDWSWWWVLSPLWIWAVIITALIAAAMVVGRLAKRW